MSWQLCSHHFDIYKRPRPWGVRSHLYTITLKKKTCFCCCCCILFVCDNCRESNKRDKVGLISKFLSLRVGIFLLFKKRFHSLSLFFLSIENNFVMWYHSASTWAITFAILWIGSFICEWVLTQLQVEIWFLVGDFSGHLPYWIVRIRTFDFTPPLFGRLTNDAIAKQHTDTQQEISNRPTKYF